MRGSASGRDEAVVAAEEAVAGWVRCLASPKSVRGSGGRLENQVSECVRQDEDNEHQNYNPSPAAEVGLVTAFRRQILVVS